MKTVLFCGGLGTRIRDYSETIPKPMVPIGDKPILWHLMHYYSEYGHRTSFCALATRRTSSRNSSSITGRNLRRLCRLGLWRQH